MDCAANCGLHGDAAQDDGCCACSSSRLRSRWIRSSLCATAACATCAAICTFSAARAASASCAFCAASVALLRARRNLHLAQAEGLARNVIFDLLFY